MTKVAILGGGVAGLSAAHELMERGFDVQVYEARVWGGKARSIMCAGEPPTNAPGQEKPKASLPSEHGFRFFPAFYKHLPDTMKRIPIKGTAKKVVDNLVGATEVGIFQKNALKIVLPGRYPTSWAEWEQAFYDLLHARFNISDYEMKFFVERLLVILTSCEERRVAEYEKIDWWSFIQAERFSDEYKKIFGIGLTRSLVAMRAEVASTRTVGDILLQLILYMFVLDVNDDCVLNAPTNDAWINPWIEYLEGKIDKDGRPIVKDKEGKPTVDKHDNPLGNKNLHLNAETLRLHCDGRKITGATIKFIGDKSTGEKDREEIVTADYFICAFPVEVMQRLLKNDEDTPDIFKLTTVAPSLAGVPKLCTEWMNGIQFFLKREIPVVKGHAIYLDSAWALTSISQHQFWTDIDLAKYGDGSVKDILSVDISNWTAPGTETTNKPAKECTGPDGKLDKFAIKEEVWAQLKAHLNRGGEIVLDDKDLVAWNLDPDITDGATKGVEDAEPLLVNTINSWQNRPTADLEIPNLLLASDYVQTNTDLATMEGANEAARRAVNSILEKTGSMLPRCRLWPLSEPEMFAPMREYDLLRFNMGLPHARRSWLTVSLTGSYYWGTVISEAIAVPVLRAGWDTGGALAAPVLRVGWKTGGTLAAPVLRAGWKTASVGWNTASVMVNFLRALGRKPPNS